jgi:UDP-N-acetylmuramyl tripeptide synthase
MEAAKPLSIDHKGSGKKDPEIRSIHYRSQDVKPGGLFVAIAGHTADGHDYVDDAIERGAVAVISQKEIKGKTLNIRVADTRQALADIAACFFDLRLASSEPLTIGIRAKPSTTR